MIDSPTIELLLAQLKAEQYREIIFEYATICAKRDEELTDTDEKRRLAILAQAEREALLSDLINGFEKTISTVSGYQPPPEFIEEQQQKLRDILGR